MAACAIAASALLATEAVAEDDPILEHLYQRAESCIRDAAPVVERADPSLFDDAQFLLSYACVRELSPIVRYKQNVGLLALLRSASAEMQDTRGMPEAQRKAYEAEQAEKLDLTNNVSIDPDTGAFVTKNNSAELLLKLRAMGQAEEQALPATDEVYTRLRSFAGRELLAARLAHQTH